ncbi:unnamed protein product, partial [Nesidiocoris tenuis]
MNTSLPILPPQRTPRPRTCDTHSSQNKRHSGASAGCLSQNVKHSAASAGPLSHNVRHSSASAGRSSQNVQHSAPSIPRRSLVPKRERLSRLSGPLVPERETLSRLSGSLALALSPLHPQKAPCPKTCVTHSSQNKRHSGASEGCLSQNLTLSRLSGPLVPKRAALSLPHSSSMSLVPK